MGAVVTKPQRNALRYAVVTAARDEAESIGRLLHCLDTQTVRPERWQVVDTGSRDGTAEIVRAASSSRDWVDVTVRDNGSDRRRGAVVADALETGFALVPPGVEVVIKVDADVTFAATHMALLLQAFERDPTLGIASGSRYELKRGRWRRQSSTGTGVESPCRAYRVRCLADVLPFERSLGWDGVDLAQAHVRGWRTCLVERAAFQHHRGVGARERSRLSARWQEGVASHHMGYRPTYVCLRTAYRAFFDPAAIALLLGFVASRWRGQPLASSAEAVCHIREEQALRRVPMRAAESLGLRSPGGDTRGRTDVLLVADGGGHLYELAALDTFWRAFERVWVTSAGLDPAELPPGEDVIYAHGPTCRSLVNLVRNTLLAIRVVGRLRPRVVVSTGSALAVPFAWIARIFGGRVVFIECSGRVGLSLSCKLLAPVANRVYVQWPELVGTVGRSRHAGSIFFSRQ